MTLVEMATQPWGVIQTKELDGSLTIHPGEVATFKNLDDSPAIHWDSPGGSSSTGVVVSDSEGELNRFIESGRYKMTVNGEERSIEAVAGGGENMVASVMSPNGHYWQITGDDTGHLITTDVGVGTPPHGPPPYATLAELAEVKHTLLDWANVRTPTGIYTGAVGDGTTDDRAVIQAHITAVIAAGGGTVYFPGGFDYMIGSPGLNVPSNNLPGVRLQGAGMGGTKTVSNVTRLLRNGTHSLFSATGTGVNDGEQVQGLSFRDMTISGNGFAGNLLSLRRCGDLEMENVRLTACLATALYATQAWNWRIRNLIVNGSGDLAADKPAIFFGDEGVASSNTNTVDISQLTAEANLWHDVVLEGSVAAGNTAYVEITNSKFERAVGYAMVWGRSTGCSITNSFLHTNGANGVLKCVNGESNNFEANTVDLGPTSTATETIRFEGGITPVIAGNNFIGRRSSPLARAIALLDTGTGTVEIYGNTFQGNWTSEVVDNRTTPAGLLEIRGQVRAYDGVVHKTKAGIPTDADFLRTPPNGTTIIDTTNSKIYVRIGGTWKSTAALT